MAGEYFFWRVLYVYFDTVVSHFSLVCHTNYLILKACFGAASFGWDSGVIGGVIKLQPFIE